VSEIIEQLREACKGHPSAQIPWPHRLLHDAADKIDQLLTDNMILADNRMDEYRENIKLTEKIGRLNDEVSRLRDTLEILGIDSSAVLASEPVREMTEKP